MGQEALNNTAVTADLAGDEAIPSPVDDCMALTLTNDGSKLLASLLPADSSTAKEMAMSMTTQSVQSACPVIHLCLVHGTATIPS